MDADGRVWIGTSGWVYKHWLDIFYPPKLPSSEQLPFYAQHFSTVEINFSFYRLPERKVFEGWRQRTPESFLFAVKGSRYLTHIRKLEEPEEPVERLMDRAQGLGEKLGPILFQFPPSWSVDTERLRVFLMVLKPYRDQRFVFEFRHKTWLIPEVYQLLEQADAALCLPVGPRSLIDVHLTASWTYIRMHQGTHGTGFDDDELKAWAERIRSYRDRKVDTYIYFNNDPGGHALKDAERIRQMLG